jgi:hypothetical protein
LFGKEGENIMPEQGESVVKLPLFDQAAIALKETGVFEKELSAQELAQIMSGVITSLTAGQDAVKASVAGMQVQIEKSRGVVRGAVRVEKPIQATIKVNCALANDTSPQKVRLDGLDIQQEAGFAAKLALKAVNIEGKAREALQNPNQALGLALGSQLAPRGVQLTGLGLHFNERSLAVSLKGRPMQPRR